MSIYDDIEKLPGVVCKINPDWSLGYDISKFGSTDSVVVVGTAFKGAVGVPIPIYSPEHAEYIFGGAYNSDTKKQATLTADLTAAYKSGCRTLYGVRVSGSDIYKDFNFCTDTDLKLRVRSYSPHNVKKECYILVDLTAGAEKITLFKPAIEATMSEKSEGLVESENSVMAVEMEINLGYVKSVDDKLVDIIKIFNDHEYNKSMVLEIVDADGNVVTNSEEAQNLCFGDMYPGVYFIGRDQSLCAKETNRKFVLVNDSTTDLPYASFDGLYYRKLVLNTDISQPFPIYYTDIKEMRSILKEVGITMTKAWDFLKVTGSTDKAFVPDTVDYEEVDISKFQLYKKLGSGYVTTASAVRRTDDKGNDITPKVRQTPSTDSNSILSINDGIYSMLQNERINYRVLGYGNADDSLVDPIPKAKDFLTMQTNSVKILGDTLIAESKIDAADRHSSKSYSIRFESLSNAGSDTFTDVYTDVIAEMIPFVSNVNEITDKSVETGLFVMLLDSDGTGHLKRTTETGYDSIEGQGLIGDLFIVNGTLYIGVDKSGTVIFSPATVDTDATTNVSTYKGKEYILGENNDTVYVYHVITPAAGSTSNIEPLGDLNSMLGDNETETTVFMESNYWGKNQIVVRSAAFSGMTIGELVDYLNGHISLGKKFTFSITEDNSEFVDDIVTDIVKADSFNVNYDLDEDRTLAYDYNLYIPYKTSDNLARQFAQHCTYTKITTGQTHGIIGLKTIMSVASAHVAKRADEVLKMDFDLYIKSYNGRKYLDSQNKPVPLGGNLSIPLFQEIVTMSDGYQYTSNGAAEYAGMVSNLAVTQSSTNQPITLFSSPAYTLTNYQLGKLNDKGIVTIKSTITLGNVITDGTTMAPADSHFRRLSVTRALGYIELIIRAACEPYIGKENNKANRNAMNSAIKSVMDEEKDRTINDYEFSMSTDASTAKLNNIEINYTIIPLYEIRKVRNIFTIKDQS